MRILDGKSIAGGVAQMLEALAIICVLCRAGEVSTNLRIPTGSPDSASALLVCGIAC